MKASLYSCEGGWAKINFSSLLLLSLFFEVFPQAAWMHELTRRPPWPRSVPWQCTLIEPLLSLSDYYQVSDLLYVVLHTLIPGSTSKMSSGKSQFGHRIISVMNFCTISDSFDSGGWHAMKASWIEWDLQRGVGITLSLGISFRGEIEFDIQIQADICADICMCASDRSYQNDNVNKLTRSGYMHVFCDIVYIYKAGPFAPSSLKLNLYNHEHLFNFE